MVRVNVIFRVKFRVRITVLERIRVMVMFMDRYSVKGFG